jgi:hypothetical protein
LDGLSLLDALPDVPGQPPAAGGAAEDPDFDDLMQRLERMKQIDVPEPDSDLEPESKPKPEPKRTS